MIFNEIDLKIKIYLKEAFNMNFMIILGGLQGLQTTIIRDWIGPALLIVIAAMAVFFAFKRQFREMIIFLVIGAIAAVLVFGGSALFSADGAFTSAAEGIATQLGN
jgi:hypothetical protein